MIITNKIVFILFLILFGLIVSVDSTFTSYFKDANDAYISISNGTTLKCGKNNPKKENDCIKYGTDSDFYCCYIESSYGKACGLVSYTRAGKPQGDKKFKLYQDNTLGVCSQTFLKFSFSIIFLIFVFLI